MCRRLFNNHAGDCSTMAGIGALAGLDAGDTVFCFFAINAYRNLLIAENRTKRRYVVHAKGGNIGSMPSCCPLIDRPVQFLQRFGIYKIFQRSGIEVQDFEQLGFFAVVDFARPVEVFDKGKRYFIGLK